MAESASKFRSIVSSMIEWKTCPWDKIILFKSKKNDMNDFILLIVFVCTVQPYLHRCQGGMNVFLYKEGNTIHT